MEFPTNGSLSAPPVPTSRSAASSPAREWVQAIPLAARVVIPHKVLIMLVDGIVGQVHTDVIL